MGILRVEGFHGEALSRGRKDSPLEVAAPRRLLEGFRQRSPDAQGRRQGFPGQHAQGRSDEQMKGRKGRNGIPGKTKEGALSLQHAVAEGAHGLQRKAVAGEGLL